VLFRSIEAIEKQLQKVKSEKITVNVLRADVGDINEDDVKLASSGEKALVIGFNVKCPADVMALAERFGVSVQIFNIIYEAETWLESEVKKREPLEEKEEVKGTARVLKIFKEEKTKKIVGGDVTSGTVSVNKEIKIYRRSFLLGEGRIVELQEQKIKAKEVTEGNQFGALIQTKVEILPKDTFEVIEKTVS